MSLVLLVGAGLMIRSFDMLHRVDTGFRSEGRLTFEVSLPPPYRDPDQTEQFLRQYLARLNSMPQVQAAGAVSMRPVTGGTTNMGIWAEDDPAGAEEATLLADWRNVTPGYFRAMGISLVRGANFSESDRLVEPARVTDQMVTDSVAAERFNVLLLTFFAAIALVLALAGVYGVMAYSVTRRTSEIGVRVALGASPGGVLKQTIWYGMRPALIGMGVGLAGAFGLSRLLTNLLFGIEPSDPVTYAGVALFLGIAALASCYLPARRALRVDPVAALREE